MIRHLLKIILSQRKTNLWIFAELLVVICAVWWMSDQLYVDLRTYYSSMGYDISNSWRFQLDLFSPEALGYVPEEVNPSPGGEDITKLQQQIKQHPAVEDVYISSYSAPYSFGNSWRSIEPVDGDTAIHEQGFQCRFVSPEYFDMFRITDIQGNSITQQLKDKHNPVIVSEDLALKFFHTNDVRGRQVRYLNEGGEHMTIVAVSVPYRDNDFVRSEPFFYKLITPQNINDYFAGNSAKYAEFCVRMKQPFSQDEMNEFLREMGDRLVVNNLHVFSANSIEYYRDLQINETIRKQDRKLSLMIFLLVNVLFGITGTFWLRGQSRYSEIGLRIALGANRGNIKYFMYMEGLLILLLTTPLTLAFAFHMIFLDLLDTYRIPYTIGRFVITYGGAYLLTSVMIMTGVRLPVRKAVQIAPAEALYYE
ncbi:MAG: ABC transporter permease [Tannerella sp.]|nr:ABC transporter permease [Tannerella sp.]